MKQIVTKPYALLCFASVLAILAGVLLFTGCGSKSDSSNQDDHSQHQHSSH